jgi:hypothetical protein
VKPIPYVPHPGLAGGFDAADLVEAGCLPSHLPAFELVALPAEDPPPPRPPALVLAPSARERRPAGDRHAELVERITAAIDRRGIEPDAADGWRRRDTGALCTVSLKELAADIWYDLLSQQEVALGHVTDVLGVLAKRARHVRREGLIAKLTGRAATDAGREALKAWVRMVTGAEAHVDVRVMAHWLWLVKRLATDRRTEYDLMPIVFGEQGSGKSTATERLVAPLEELSTTINASTLTDERRFRQLGVCLIGRWEEMQGAGRAEIESLKHTVTAHELNYRELSTHSMVVLRRTMSFIGTSNNSVDVMVGDTTGARRFYQLTTPSRCDFALMDRIDYEQVWQAVSETERAPILDVIEVVREAQATLVHRDAVSMWLEAETWDRLTLRMIDAEQPITIDAYVEGEGCPFEDLAARFKHWCNEVGQSGIGVKMLAQRLKQEGWKQERPRVNVAPGRPRVRKYHRPRPPEPPPVALVGEIVPNPPAAPERPPRGARLAAEPTAIEDAFASEPPPAAGPVDLGPPPDDDLGGGAYAFE